MTISSETSATDMPLKLLPADRLESLKQELALAAQLEAHLIVAQQPLTAVELATVTGQPVAQVTQTLKNLQADYNGKNGQERGFELREIAGGYRYYVREKFDPLVAELVTQQQTSRLSQAALETLAVIAYKQPISRGAVAAIRAVNVDSVVRTLVARGLIREVDHDPETGAALYGTTAELLEHLGLQDISQLPPIAPLLDDGAEGFADERV